MSSEAVTRETPAAASGAALTVSGAMLTDKGAVRPGNEDRVAYAPRQDKDGRFAGAVAIVSDGMGGHAAGEVASEIAVEVLVRGFWASAAPPAERLLACAHEANAAILAAADDNPELRGMGATLTALAFMEGRAFLVHVGDSRAYLLRDGALNQLSDDQTYVAKLVREGAITPEEAKTHPESHVILQALGTGRAIVPAIDPEGIALEAGDRFILCSDGLTNMVEDEHIRRIVLALEPQAACEALIRDAIRAGGFDNISVGVFAVEGAAARASSPDADDQVTTRRLPSFGTLDAREKEAAGASAGNSK